MSACVRILVGLISLVVVQGMNLRNHETPTLPDHQNLFEVLVADTPYSTNEIAKREHPTLKRSKRTLILLRELDSSKGAQIGDTCDIGYWEKYVNSMYNLSQQEGRLIDKEGLKLANATRIYVLNETQNRAGPPERAFSSEKAFKSWASMMCIGRYPLKCAKDVNDFSVCQCLDLYPLYNFTQDIPEEKFCNVRPGEYCNEAVDLYCAHSYKCIKHVCQKGGTLNFKGGQRAIYSNYGALIITAFTLITYSLY